MTKKPSLLDRVRLKGCRPSAEIMQEYSQVSAQLGDIIFQIDRAHSDKQKHIKRQRELRLEMDAAQEQEKALKEKEAKEAAAQAVSPSPEVAHAV